MFANRSLHLIQMLITCLLVLPLTESAALAVQLPEAVQQALDREYPEAKIVETEIEKYNNLQVYEVELEENGSNLRVLFSELGELLKEEKSAGIPFIGGSLSLGIAVRGESSIYRGADDEYSPMPAVIYGNGRFQLQVYDGINTSFDLYSANGFVVSLYGEMSMDGFETGDSTYLGGMDEPGTTFSAGLALGLETKLVDFEMTAINDVSGEHDGQEVELTMKRDFPVLGGMFTPSLSIIYLSDDITDYYYGVGAAEVRPDRPSYKPGSALNAGAELMMVYPISDSFDLVGIIEYTYLDNAITYSPLIDEDYELEATIGVLYTF